LRFIHRAWRDDSGSMGFIRGSYDAVARVLPERFRANKFLVIYEKTA
jgi:hypothetical protein